MKRAAAYARYSSDRQSDLSIEAQLAEIRRYCQMKGYTIVQEYIDRAESAKTADRPAFQKMISDAKEGKFDIIVAHKRDRLFRNRYDAVVYEAELEKHGVRIETVMEPTSGSPADVLIKGVMDAVNEWYRLNLKNEIETKVRKLAEKGKYFLGGYPPLGYDLKEVKDEYGKTRKVYVVNEEEAELVRLIFQMYAQGYSMKRIAEYLNEHGFRTKRGAEWKVSSVREILDNWKYGGYYTWGRDKHGRRHVNREDMVKVYNPDLQIVDSETFWAVRKRLEQSVQTRRRKVHYLLSGIIYCGFCGSKMGGAVWGSKDKVAMYYCTRAKNYKTHKMLSISKRRVENFVISYIKNIILDPDRIDFEKLARYMNEKYEKEVSTKSVERQKVLEELETVRQELRNIVEAIKKGISFEDLEKEAERLKKKEEELRKKLKEVSEVKSELVTAEELRRRWELFRRMLFEGSDEEKEQVIKTLINRVIVYEGGYIEIVPRIYEDENSPW